ncbi:hypothetical protein J437_LFUL011236, partial [Ladona fulva]
MIHFSNSTKCDQDGRSLLEAVSSTSGGERDDMPGSCGSVVRNSMGQQQHQWSYQDMIGKAAYAEFCQGICNGESREGRNGAGDEGIGGLGEFGELGRDSFNLNSSSDLGGGSSLLIHDLVTKILEEDSSSRPFFSSPNSQSQNEQMLSPSLGLPSLGGDQMDLLSLCGNGWPPSESSSSFSRRDCLTHNSVETSRSGSQGYPNDVDRQQMTNGAGVTFSQDETNSDMTGMGSNGLASLLCGENNNGAADLTSGLQRDRRRMMGRVSAPDRLDEEAVATANLIGLSQLDGMGIGFPLHGDTFPDHLQATLPIMPSAQLHPLLQQQQDQLPSNVLSSPTSSSLYPISSQYPNSQSSQRLSTTMSAPSFSQPPPSYASHSRHASSSGGNPSSPPTSNGHLGDLSPSSDSGFPSPLSLYSPSSCDSTPPTRGMNGILGMDQTSGMSTMDYN